MEKINDEIRDAIEIGLASVIHTLRPADEEAEQLLHEPTRGWKGTLSPTKPERVMRHFTRVQLLVDQQRADEAEPLMRLAYEFAHQKTIPGSYFQGVADSLMGSWLAAKEPSAEAERCLLAGVENLCTSRGDNHRLTARRQVTACAVLSTDGPGG